MQTFIIFEISKKEFKKFVKKNHNELFPLAIEHPKDLDALILRLFVMKLQLESKLLLHFYSGVSMEWELQMEGAFEGDKKNMLILFPIFLLIWAPGMSLWEMFSSLVQVARLRTIARDRFL